MLNSCASGISVVNIDNGFGAAYQASLINKLAAKEANLESMPKAIEGKGKLSSIK